MVYIKFIVTLATNAVNDNKNNNRDDATRIIFSCTVKILII